MSRKGTFRTGIRKRSSAPAELRSVFQWTGWPSSVGLARVVEQEEPQRPRDVEVVLRVEEHEFVAAQSRGCSLTGLTVRTFTPRICVSPPRKNRS